MNSRARARKDDADVQLVFRRKLAMQMLENKIDDMGFVLGIPTSPIRLSSRPRPDKHVLKKRDLGRAHEEKLDHNSRPLPKNEVCYMQKPGEDLLCM